MRAAWQCDCQGPPGPATEDPAVRVARTAVEAATGWQPPTCPWRAYSDPDVLPILDAYRAIVDGEGHEHLHALAQADLCPATWDGLNLYVQLRRKIRLDEAEKERKRLDSQRRRTHGRAG